MLNRQTLDKLSAMKLIGMAQAFADQLNQPDLDRLSFEERFGLLVDRQWTWKENNRMERYLKNARMKLNACVEDIDYKTPRGIDQSVMMSLISCDWVKRRHNVIITGPTGAGKTFLACALTNKACREGSLCPIPQVLIPDGARQGRWKLWENHRQACQGPCPGHRRSGSRSHD